MWRAKITVLPRRIGIRSRVANRPLVRLWQTSRFDNFSFHSLRVPCQSYPLKCLGNGCPPHCARPDLPLYRSDSPRTVQILPHTAQQSSRTTQVFSYTARVLPYTAQIYLAPPRFSVAPLRFASHRWDVPLQRRRINQTFTKSSQPWVLPRWQPKPPHSETPFHPTKLMICLDLFRSLSRAKTHPRNGEGKSQRCCSERSR